MNLTDTVRTLAKRALPNSLKARLKEAARPAALALAVERLRRLRPDVPLDSRLVAQLRYGWGNDRYSAPAPFLERVAERARDTGGPILECGSGCSTLFLGLLAGTRGVEVWSLEHDLDWLHATQARLDRFRIPNVHLLHAPLCSYGEFDWYGLPDGTPLPGRFTVVVCDGPPSLTTLGSRYGLLPVLGDRLPAGTEVLVDDAARPEEQGVIERWGAERPLRVDLDEDAGRGVAHLILC
jgi:hypothetical protein